MRPEIEFSFVWLRDQAKQTRCEIGAIRSVTVHGDQADVAFSMQCPLNCKNPARLTALTSAYSTGSTTPSPGTSPARNGPKPETRRRKITRNWLRHLKHIPDSPREMGDCRWFWVLDFVLAS